MEIQIAGCLRNNDAEIPHQFHWLKLEFAAELLSLL